jgi:pimeloyl-ACP methyl ester carboxylesterase
VGLDFAPEIPTGNDEFMETLVTRDHAFAIRHLGWKEAAFLGFSMGGKQLLSFLY